MTELVSKTFMTELLGAVEKDKEVRLAKRDRVEALESLAEERSCKKQCVAASKSKEAEHVSAMSRLTQAHGSALSSLKKDKATLAKDNAALRSHLEAALKQVSELKEGQKDERALIDEAKAIAVTQSEIRDKFNTMEKAVEGDNAVGSGAHGLVSRGGIDAIGASVCL